MDIFQTIKEELKVEKWQVEAAVKLIDEGCTIPFISRYRKEATGSLNDEQLRDLDERPTCAILKRRRSRFWAASRSKGS